MQVRRASTRWSFSWHARFSEREVNIPSRQRPAEKGYDFRCETRIQVLNHCPLLQPRKAVKKC